jgi:hypothetical protein
MTADRRREWTGRVNGVIPLLAGLCIGYVCQRRLAFEPIVNDYRPRLIQRSRVEVQVGRTEIGICPLRLASSNLSK